MVEAVVDVVGDPVAVLLAVGDLLRERLAVGIAGQQLVEQVGGTRDVLAGLFEQFEVDTITRREHLGEPWHQPMVFGV